MDNVLFCNSVIKQTLQKCNSLPEVITWRCCHNQECISHLTYIYDLIFITVGQGLATSLLAYLPTIMCAFGMCWMENVTSNIGFLHQLWKLVVRWCICWWKCYRSKNIQNEIIMHVQCRGWENFYTTKLSIWKAINMWISFCWLAYLW